MDQVLVRMAFIRLASALSVALIASCVSPDDGEVDGEEELLDDGGADGYIGVRGGTLKESVRGVTISFDRTLRLTTRDEQKVWVLSGTSNVKLASVFSFIADDAYAQTVVADDGLRFEVRIDARSEINSILSGIRLYLDFTIAAPTATIPAKISSSLTFAPAMRAVSGSTSVRVSSGIKPIAIGKELVYRTVISGRSAGTLSVDGFDVDNNGVLDAVAAQRGTSYNLDWTFAGLASVADEDNAPLPVRWVRPSGATWHRELRTKAMLASFEMAVTDDPYNRWPTDFNCSTTVQACLDRLGGELDTERCGNYRAVRRCNVRGIASQLLVAPESLTNIQSVLDQANAGRPEATHTSASAWIVNGNSPRVPDSLQQVMVGTQLFDLTRGAVIPPDGGAMTASGAQSAFTQLRMNGLLAAVRSTFATTEVLVGKMTASNANYYVISAPAAARALVVRVPRS